MRNLAIREGFPSNFSLPDKCHGSTRAEDWLQHRYVPIEQKLLTTVYNCAQIKLTVPRDGGSLWEMPFNISAGDRHDQEQDSEQDYVE